MTTSHKPWIPFDPTNPQRSKNIDPTTWALYRPLISNLLEEGKTRQQILEIVWADAEAQKRDFRPS
jgi:hypothetical protein